MLLFLLRFSWVRNGGKGQKNQSGIWEEAELHEQGVAEAAVSSEGARPAPEEPVTVRETAEETADGRDWDEEDKGEGNGIVILQHYLLMR